MLVYGNNFFIEYFDDGHITKDCGVEVKFDQSIRASHCDENMIKGKVGYIGKMQEIMQVDLPSFQCVIFSCKWWDTFDHINVKEYCDSGLICMNSKKRWVESKEPYVFSKHCNQVFYYPDVLVGDWWFILRHDPISKHVFENNNVTMLSKEDNQGDGNAD